MSGRKTVVEMTDQPDWLFAAIDSLLAAVDDGTVLTQAAVARALGARVPSIQAWEAGRAEP